MEFYKVQTIDEITTELIYSLIERYKFNEVPRIKKLKEYYKGNTDIKDRTMNDPSKPNNKVSNPYPSLLVDTIQGYFLGKPVNYSSQDESMMQRLQEIFDNNYEQSHNSKLGRDMSITGIAYELIYMNEQNEVNFSILDPQETFMIYDNSIKKEPLAGVRFYEVQDYVSDEVITNVEVYTSDLIQYFVVDNENLVLVDEQPHYFNEVPINVYFNNDEVMGDFEKVIDLIDAYDKAVSDSSNNLEYFADSYLVLSNVEMDEEDIDKMKENRVMILGENGEAEWLIKGTNNVEIEEFKDRIKEDIFQFAQIPNLSDEKFGNNTSGVSLQYKIFGLENKVANVEKSFKKSLEQRVRLITNILNIKGGQFNSSSVKISFTRNLPTNLAQVTDMINKLSGIVSNETLIGLLPFIDDVAYEKELLTKEQEGTLYENFAEDVQP